MFEINYTTRTDEHTKVDTIKWIISDIRNVLQDNKKEYRIENPKEADTDITSEFSLKMKLLGHDNDVIEIYFQSSEPIMLLSVYLTNNWCGKETNIYNSLQRCKWQFLYKSFRSNIKYCSLELTVEFKVTYFNTVDCFNISKRQLNNDVEDIFKSSIFSDTIVKSAEGKEFKFVHKAILAGRSEVLKANFEHNTTECASNIVESPFKADVLEEVLKFIYSDIARVDDMPEELLAAADYYQLYRLKCLCEERLFKKLTKDNAIDTLQFAELHSAKTLKQMALEFIKDACAKCIFKTEGWSNIKSVALLKELCEYIGSDNSYELVELNP